MQAAPLWPSLNPVSSSPAAWPVPDADARARSAALRAALREEAVRAGGAISFRRFMEAALYAPGLGYYSGGATKLGPAGDFVTAPELSPLFGRCIARQARAVLEAVGGGAVLELGGGSGALAAAALAEAGELRWLMLEPSPELRERQQRRLGDRVAWVDTLPQDFRGVILANEVADALPVERFTVQAGELHALGVSFAADGTPAWALLPPSPALAAAVHEIETARGAPFPDGYMAEFSPLLQPWVRSLADSLAAGLVLVIDYGLPRAELYAAERSMGTLMCHYRHRAHDDPFLWPGLQDITAWVDFTAVAAAGVDAGLTLEGYTTQAAFLAGNGLETMLQEVQEDGTTAGIMQAQQARRLLLPEEMGERFRVLGLSRHLEPALDGFGLVDLANRL